MTRKLAAAVLGCASLAFAQDANRPDLSSIDRLALESQLLAFQGDVLSNDHDYQAGSQALDHDRFEEAVRDFTTLIDKKGARADGAYYWKAYAQNRLGRRDQALQTIGQLRSTYPRSSWLNEARALELEIHTDQGHPVSPSAEKDDELKLMAINSLMQSEPAQAVPILRKLLESNQNPAIKERALFVLSQSSSPDARHLLLDMARGQVNPDLQAQAIRYIGMMGGDDLRGELPRIYASSSDVALKRDIIRSYLLSGSKQALLDAARHETNPELRAEAIRTLAQTGGKEELWSLYQSVSSEDAKDEIVKAMLLDGDSEHLLAIAKTEKSPAIRKDAIRTLALTGWGKESNAMVDLYNSERDPEVKRQLIQGMFLQQNAKGLVDLARREKDPDLKRYIVSQLALIHSKESTDYMMELLK